MSSIERPQVVLVSRCAIEADRGNILLVKRTLQANHNAGLWEFPGGKVDQGQVVEEAMVREVKEETGYDIEPTSSSVFVGNRVIQDGPYAGMLYAILCATGKIAGGELVLSSEHTAACWAHVGKFAESFALTAETKQAAQLLGSLAFINK